eukprot:1141330-Pelagomonas_calceolata.AAC.10
MWSIGGLATSGPGSRAKLRSGVYVRAHDADIAWQGELGRSTVRDTRKSAEKLRRQREAAKPLWRSIKEKGLPRAEAPRIPFIER